MCNFICTYQKKVLTLHRQTKKHIIMKTITLKQLAKNVLSICNSCNEMTGVRKCSKFFVEEYLKDMTQQYDEFLIFINPLYDIFITGNIEKKGMGYKNENDLVLHIKKKDGKFYVEFNK